MSLGCVRGPETIGCLGACDLTDSGGHKTYVSFSRGKFGPKLEPVWLKKVGKEDGPWICNRTKVTKDSLPRTDKVQIRITAPFHFRDQFLPDDVAHDLPSCVITQLASTHDLKAN